MAKASTTPRKPVTSDPDRGIPVNSGTDPQRPGTARPVPTRRPKGPHLARPGPPGSSPSPNEDVEHGRRNEPDDPV